MTYREVLRGMFRPDEAEVPQTVPLAGQIPNAAGGWTYEIDCWQRLDRFLTLGSTNGTYYTSGARLTQENVLSILECLREDGARTVARIVEISDTGRAPQAQAGLFALALASAAEDADTRRAALAALPRVARIGTHILTYADYVNEIRGWGRALRRSVGTWFTDKTVDRLALQAVKYSQRDGWALRDLLRLSHPVTEDLDLRAVIDWIAHPNKAAAIDQARASARVIDGMYAARAATSAAEVAAVIERYSLPREAVPTQWLNDAGVWDALLVDMPMTAMIRNLGKMSIVGLLEPGSAASAFVAERLRDATHLRAARVHPVQLLLALRTYAAGRGLLGKLAWSAVPQVVDALDEAYDLSFQFLPRIDKPIMVAVDVSGSMRYAFGQTLKPVEVAAAMAMTFLRTGSNVEVFAFDTQLHAMGVSARQRLDDMVKTFGCFGGGTDVSLPFQHVLDTGRYVDGLVVLTDGETWAGKAHPIKVLLKARLKVNHDLRIAWVAATATGGQLTSPSDKKSLGVAGFDAAVPRLVGDFIAGAPEQA